ncbi:long-chain-fatty-acid--coa ligase [Anaeramoeba flamelloides]|uniref:Long-chain-fatty-acid--coa ligase n=1 Tax=Anaeramoeba flamelloides TaxID=1746091 RepID=A0AAV7ZHS1_9EUKA|nr:long-chain-fatty-acid--coa ligase [Anaeramoeba flamelloides]
MGSGSSKNETNFFEEQGYIYLNGESPIYRSKLCKDGLISTFDPEVKTLYQIFENTLEKYQDYEYLGHREFKNEEYGSYVWMNRKDFSVAKHYFACGLVSLGMKKGDPLALYAPNCTEWCIGESGCHCQSFVSVTLFDTLGYESSELIINECKIKFLLCDKTKLERIAELKPNCKTLEYIICIEPEINQKHVHKLQELGLEVLSLDQIIDLGKENDLEDNPPEPEDIATIMYTSGTTGTPKGVILTHQNLIASITGCLLESRFKPSEKDTHFSFLPLAHILERTLLNVVTAMGGKIGFFAGDYRNLLHDLVALKPTIFVGVPRVFQRIYDSIMLEISKKSKFHQYLFQLALNSKREALKNESTTPLWDYLFFNAIRDRFGGRVNLLISGSAPLPKKIYEFYQLAVTPHTIQGYGLSETGAACTVNWVKGSKTYDCGSTCVCNEIKLVDVPEMNYFSKNGILQGEIWVRGFNVFQGYYKNEELTNQVLTKEGWFKTGDIGEITKLGTLKIIDRKKNIFKLAQGEYVASEYLEDLYQHCPSISRIYIYGDSKQRYLVGIVLPNFKELKIYGRERQEEVCKSEKFKETIMEDIRKKAHESRLKSFEILKNVYLEFEPFTIYNKCLTTTMELRRFYLREKYKDILQELYEEINTEIKKEK